MNFEELKSAVFAAADKAGIREYEIYYKNSTDISAETLGHEISSFSSGTDCGICFRCKVGGKMGYASTQLMEKEEMAELVERALAGAAGIESTDEVMIFEGSPEYAPEPDNNTDIPDAATLRRIALDLQEKNYAADTRVTDGTQAAVIAGCSEIRICNSYGLDLKCGTGLRGGYSMLVIDGEGEKSSGFAFRGGMSIGELSDAATEAATDAASKLNAGEVESGKYNIIFNGKQMRSLLGAFTSAFSAKQAQNGLSLLAGKEGQKIASECVTLTDDPMYGEGSNRIHFDAEGVATKKKNVVEKGVLTTLLYNLACAAKAGNGQQTTGNASKGGYSGTVGISPFTFYINPGEYSRDGLLALAGDGLLITELKGLHAGANAVTGDFSIESAGFEFKDGKITRPVKTFTVAGNFFTLLTEIAALGDTVDFGIPGGLTTFGAPDTYIPGMSVAGK